VADPNEALLLVPGLRFVLALVTLPVLVSSLRFLPVRGVPLAAVSGLVGILFTTLTLGLSLPLASTLILASCLLLLPALIFCLSVALCSILSLAPGLVSALPLASIVALVAVLILSAGFVGTLALTLPLASIVTLAPGLVAATILPLPLSLASTLTPGLVVVATPVAVSVHAGGARVPGPSGDGVTVAAMGVGGRARKAHPARILVSVADPEGVVPALALVFSPVVVLVASFVGPSVRGAAGRVGRSGARGDVVPVAAMGVGGGTGDTDPPGVLVPVTDPDRGGSPAVAVLIVVRVPVVVGATVHIPAGRAFIPGPLGDGVAVAAMGVGRGRGDGVPAGILVSVTDPDGVLLSLAHRPVLVTGHEPHGAAREQ